MQFDVQVLHLKPPIPLCHLCRMGPASRGNGADAIAAISRRPGPKALRSNAEPRDLGRPRRGRGKSHDSWDHVSITPGIYIIYITGIYVVYKTEIWMWVTDIWLRCECEWEFTGYIDGILMRSDITNHIWNRTGTGIQLGFVCRISLR